MNKPPVIKFKQFKAWVDKQPNNRKFHYCGINTCLIASYFRETYGINVSVSDCKYRLTTEYGTECHELFPPWLDKILVQFACHNIRLLKRKLEILSHENFSQS